jgi:hypothetical protein
LWNYLSWGRGFVKLNFLVNIKNYYFCYALQSYMFRLLNHHRQEIIFIFIFMKFYRFNMQPCNSSKLNKHLFLWWMITRSICKNWILQNEFWERYLLFKTFLLHSCLHNLPLNLFSKLFCMTKTTNMYIIMNIYDRISTSSVIVLHYTFPSYILVFTKTLLILT